MPTDEYRILIRVDRTPVGKPERRFNTPAINEVAIVLVRKQLDRRDTIIQRHNEALQRIETQIVRITLCSTE